MGGNQMSDTGLGFGYLAILLLIYFLPAVIGFSRGHVNAGAILVLNLFLGWTALGWIAALIWSFMNSAKLNRETRT
jgi:hypothetical protein